MATPKSPVEKRVELLRDLWMAHTEDAGVRLIVWRIPDNADRMLQAFFEAQRQGGDGTVPDLFMCFTLPFETGFGFSRAINESLVASYVDSLEPLHQQGVRADWKYSRVDRTDSSAGCMSLLGSFAEHHQAHLRHVAAVVTPTSVSDHTALMAWLEGALSTPVPHGVRLCVVDTKTDPKWQPLAQRHGKQVCVIDAPIDMFDIARETAAQAGGSGPAVAYRQLLTDVMALVEKGTPAQAADRAERALRIARKEQWWDQQVVLYMAVAGAHLKAQEHREAIRRYGQARDCALQAQRHHHPVGATLVMQTWFAEAGVWLMAKQPERAAQLYREGAECARGVPDPMFAIEGFRMAAYCHAQANDRTQAQEHGQLAIVASKAVSAKERPLTTLPLALQDLLRLQDPLRTEKLEKFAAQYQTEISAAHHRGEQRAKRLGPKPAHAQIDQIEAEMHAHFEASFQRLRDGRERIIASGDEYFRKVVAVGRQLLHPLWNGLPEVKHPLDQDVAAWSKPPECMPLPDASDLMEAAPDPAGEKQVAETAA